MEEVFDNPPQVAHWQALVAGNGFDPRQAFAGYRSQVDWPGAHVWQDSLAAYPEAKVIHTHRPEDIWWNSYSRTIGKLLTVQSTLDVPQHIRDMMDAAWIFIAQDTFDSRPLDRENCLAAYRARLEQVTATVPADRLLVFDVAEGWEPLCAFLGVDVPDQPFPRRNDRADFWSNLGGEPPD